MESTPPADQIDIHSLPLILAGPILRRAEPEAVTVWVALSEPREVTLEIKGEDGTILLSHSRPTVALGKHLHLVAVKAVPRDGTKLGGGIRYFYNIKFVGGASAQSLLDEGVLHFNLEQQSPRDRLYYPEALSGLGSAFHLPSFQLPPEELSKLRIIHASCRKPHGEGADMLAYLDTLIEESLADDEQSRPHQLFLTGDQIYADDVSASLLALVCDAENALLGWKEELFRDEEGGGTKTVQVEELARGKRDELVEKYTGFTAAVGPGDAAATNHLMRLGEFYAMYLFAWSPVLWPPENEREALEEELREFYSTLPEVRRALANIPTYMMFDDHEITDDWYLHREWCRNALGSTLGRRILTNGMLAFALFQAWGNTPDRFDEGAGKELLSIVERQPAGKGNWNGYSDDDYKRFYQLLGFPETATLETDNHLMPAGSASLYWHYQVKGSGYQALVLDTRTWRWFPGTEKDPPVLLGELDDNSDQSIPKQIVERHPETQLVFVISPPPVINIPWVVFVRRIFDWF
jgi:hypothetical protein